MPQEKKTYTEFSASIKEKYPQYKDVDDLTLAKKMVEKYPVYAESVDFGDTLKKKEPTASPSPLPSESSTSASTGGELAPAGKINYLTGTNDPTIAQQQQAFNQNFSLTPPAGKATPTPVKTTVATAVQPQIPKEDWQQGMQEAQAAGLTLPKNEVEKQAADASTQVAQTKQKLFDKTWVNTLVGGDNTPIKTPEQEKQDAADAYGDPVYGKALVQFNPQAISGNEKDIVNYLSTHKYYADKAYQGALSQQEQFNIINGVASEKIAKHEEAIKIYQQAGVDKLADQYLDLVEQQQEVVQKANLLGEEIKSLQAKQTSSTGAPPQELNDKIAEYNKLQQEYNDIVTKRTPLDAAEKDIRGYINELSAVNSETEKVRKAINSLPEVAETISKQKFANEDYNAFEDIGTKLSNAVVSTAGGLIAFAPKIGGDAAKAVQGREGYGIGDKIVDLVTNNGAVPFIESDKYNDITKYNPLKSPGGFIRSLTGGVAQQIPVMAAIALTDGAVNPALARTYGAVGKIASIKKADAISTTLSGFINSYKQYSEEANKMGLDPRTGLAFSSAMAMLEGLSENIMPDKQLLSPEIKKKMLRQYVIDISKGASVADAAKKMTYNFVENGVKESTEEFAVMAGDYLAKKAIEVDNPDIKAELPSINEAINTFAIAFASAGGATVLAEKRGIDTQKNLAYQSAARDIQTTKAVLKNLVNERVVSEKEALNFIDKVNKFKKSEELVPADISDIKKADIAYILAEIESAKERLDNKNLAEPVAKSIEKLVSEKEKKIDEILNDNNYEKDFNEALDKENAEPEMPKAKENENGSVEISPSLIHDESDDADMFEYLSEVEKTMPLDEGETKLKQEIMARMAASKQEEQVTEGQPAQPQQPAPIVVSEDKVEVKKPEEPAKEVKIDANQISELEKKLKQNQLDFYNEKISTLDYNKNKDALNEQLKQARAGVLQIGEATKKEEANAPIVNAKVEVIENKVEEPKVEVISEPSKEAPAENKSPATEAVEAAPSEADVQEDTPKPKKAKVSKELVDEEEMADDEKVDDPAVMSKMNDDIEVLKKMPKEDLAEKKFLGMVERAFKAMDEGKISRSAYAKFKNDAKDILEGKAAKSAVDAKDAKMKVSRAMEKVKESLLGKGTDYKKLGYLSTGIPITPQMVATMIDTATKLAHRGIDAGVAIDVAVTNAINAIKKNPVYKKLVAAKAIDEVKFEKDIRDSVKENEDPEIEPEPPQPKEEKKKPSNDNSGGTERQKSLLNRLYEAEKVSKETKEALKSFGLSYESYSNDMASEIAQGAVEAFGPEESINYARHGIEFPGSVKTMIYAHVINHYAEKEKSSVTEAEKMYYAKRQGEVADELDQFVRDSGRIISAVQKYYELSPAGILEKEIAGLRRYNEIRKKSEGLNAKKDEVLKALKNAEKTISEPKPKKSSKEIKVIREKRNTLFDQLKKSFSSTNGPTKMSPIPLSDEQVVLVAKIAATYIEEGIVRFDEFIKKLKSDVKKAGLQISDNDIQRVINADVDGENISKSLKTPLPETAEGQLASQREAIKKKQLSELNRLMPKEKNKTSLERQSEHERMLTAYNNGAFDGAGRTYTDPKTGSETSESFEDLFFQKYGLANVNKPAFREEMKKFAAAIHNTPQASSLRNQAYQQMYNYIQTYHARDYVSLVGGIWYANILSSYETHLRNLKYNSTTVAMNQTLLLAEKALIKGNFSEFFDIMSDGIKAFAGGYYEAREILKDGQVSRFDNPGTQNELERSKNAFLKLHKLPGRALRASDIMFTVPLYDMKQRELMIQYVKNEAKEAGEKVSKEEVNKRVLEYLSKTPKRLESAQKTAKGDIERVFGPNWESDRKAVANYHIRLAEVMEQTRPESVKEEAISWAKRSLLTEKPRGFWGVIANMLNTAASAKIGTDKVYISARAIVPFVNVMMNLADRMIERTPIGYVNAIRGKKGVGEHSVELTKDERTELFMKATNYTVMVGTLMVAVGAADDDDNVVITGKNTGNYQKDQSEKKAGKLEPYSVYIGGKKVMEYKDSPMSSIFAPVGYYRDYVKYGANNGSGWGYLASAFQYLSFVVDQNAMKGLSDFISFLSPKENAKAVLEKDPEAIAKNLASSAQSLYTPNILKAVNNDVRGAFGMNNYKAEQWWSAFGKDIPFVEQLMLKEEYDHLGQPVKDQFKVPLVPFEKWQPVDPYYKFFLEHGFYPSYIKDKIVIVGDKKNDSKTFTEVELTKDQMRQVHKKRGEIVKDMLDEKVPGGETLMSSMAKLSDDDFGREMGFIFSKAGKIAKSHMFNGMEIAKSKEEAINDDDEVKKSIDRAVKKYVSNLKL